MEASFDVAVTKKQFGAEYELCIAGNGGGRVNRQDLGVPTGSSVIASAVQSVFTDEGPQRPTHDAGSVAGLKPR